MNTTVKVNEVKNKLNGEISLSGAKNAALPIIVAACLCENDIVLKNVPTQLNDVKVEISILNQIGFNIEVDNTNVYVKNTKNSDFKTIMPEDCSKIRTSLLLLPLMLTLKSRISNPVPGGCNLGERKYDILINSLEQMGATFSNTDTHIVADIEGGFVGKELSYHIASTIGTENAILAGVLAKGKTIIKNANTRPEVIDLINFLNQAGANIKYSTRYVEIEGVNSLSLDTSYNIMYDRHEGLSYMILAGITRSDLKISNMDLSIVKEDVALLRGIGIDIFEWDNSVFVSAKNKKLKPFSITTSSYPGINSDMQPIFAALAATIEGESIITETRFNQRFQYITEFQKLNIDIVNYENCAIIHGGKDLIGTKVSALDLRSGVAVLFLGTVCSGTTEIDNFYQVERGYSDIVNIMKRCNIDVYKV